MHAVLAVAPATVTGAGIPLAATIAVAVTALVAIGMLIVGLRRTMRPTGRTVWFSVGVVVLVTVGSLLVGGSLAQPPAAEPEQLQLPTL